MSQFPVPSTIPADGSRDVTADLMAFLLTVPNGEEGNPSRVMFQPGTYWVEGELLLLGRSWLGLQGQGTTLVRKNPGPEMTKGYLSHIRFKHGSHIRVTNLSIVGSNTYGVYDQRHEGEHGVVFDACDDAIAKDVRPSWVWGDAFALTGSTVVQGVPPSVPCTNCHIIASTPGSAHVVAAGRHFVSATHATDCSVERMSFGSAGRSCVDLESDRTDEAIQGFLIAHNTFATAPLNFLALGGKGVRRDVYAEHNLFTAMSMHCKLGSPDGITDRFGIRFIDNVSAHPHATAGPLIALLGVAGFDFTGNVQEFALPRAVVDIGDGCSDVEAAGNEANGALSLFSGPLAEIGIDGGGNVL